MTLFLPLLRFRWPTLALVVLLVPPNCAYATPNDGRAERTSPPSRTLHSAILEALNGESLRLTWRVGELPSELESAAWQARNHAAGLRAFFFENGATLQPFNTTSPSAGWSLRTIGIGRGGTILPVEPGQLIVEDNRAEYQRDGWTEWYGNRHDGIEHGYTLMNPGVAGSTGEELVIRVLIEGIGTIVPNACGDGVSLWTTEGTHALDYVGLLTLDATGNPLRSWLSVEGERSLLIHVADQGASYPITIDPLCIAQEAKLLGSFLSAGDHFGSAVAIDGDTAVVGAPLDDVAATDSGSVYVFVRSGTAWSEEAHLTPVGGGAAQDLFGQAVDIEGDRIVIGAFSEAVSGNSNQGAAYVFSRSGSTWSQEQRLTSSDGAAGDNFGAAVSISSDWIIVGALFHSHGAISFGGGAYTFQRSGTTWTQVSELQPSDSADGDSFGETLQMDDTVAVIGSPNKVVTSSAEGRAYIFERPAGGNTWNQTAILDGDGDADDRFGSGVGVDASGWAIVGALFDDTTASNAGAAFAFQKGMGGTWSQTQKLLASDGAAGDQFGDFNTVAIDGDAALIGAPFAGTGGQVYLFDRSGTVWSESVPVLVPSGVSAGDHFSTAAISADIAIIGALGDDTSGSDAGAAYVFASPEPLLYCTGKTTSQGCVPFMTTTGTPSVSSTASFNLIGNEHVPSEAGLILYSLAKSNLSFHGGKLCVKAPIVRTAAKTPKSVTPTICGVGTVGRLSRNFNATIQGGSDPSLTVGQRVFAQWEQRDPTEPTGFGDNFTNGVRFVICP